MCPMHKRIEEGCLTGTASSPRRTRRTHQTSARARRRRRGCHGAPARNTRPTPAPAHSTPGPAKAQTLCPRHHRRPRRHHRRHHRNCRCRLLLRPRHRVRRIPRGETPTGTVARTMTTSLNGADSRIHKRGAVLARPRHHSPARRRSRTLRARGGSESRGAPTGAGEIRTAALGAWAPSRDAPMKVVGVQ